MQRGKIEQLQDMERSRSNSINIFPDNTNAVLPDDELIGLLLSTNHETAYADFHDLLYGGGVIDPNSSSISALPPPAEQVTLRCGGYQPETQVPSQTVHKGEFSGRNNMNMSLPNIAQRAAHSDHECAERSGLKRSKEDHQHGGSAQADMRKVFEKIRRDNIKKKIKALQDLIPNCSKTDTASILDDAVKYIKALQNQVQMMSLRAGALFQAQYMLQANYSGLQVPQNPHYMHMIPRIGMGIHGMSSAPLYMMPFTFPGPWQSNLAASGMPMVGPTPELQQQIHSYNSFRSADSNMSMANPIYASGQNQVPISSGSSDIIKHQQASGI